MGFTTRSAAAEKIRKVRRSEGVVGAMLGAAGPLIIGSGTSMADQATMVTTVQNAAVNSGPTAIYVNGPGIQVGQDQVVLVQDVVDKGGTTAVLEVVNSNGTVLDKIGETANSGPQTITVNGQTMTITTQSTMLGTPSGNGAVVSVQSTQPVANHSLLYAYPYVAAHTQEFVVLGIVMMAAGATLVLDYVRRKRVERILRKAAEEQQGSTQGRRSRWA